MNAERPAIDGDEQDALIVGMNNLFVMFVQPEIVRRQEAGNLQKPLDLFAAQVVFFPSRRTPQVRINSEVQALVFAQPKHESTGKSDDAIFVDDIESVQQIIPVGEGDQDCGHATFIRINGKWSGSFDFRYNKKQSQQLLNKAKEFIDTSEFALEQVHSCAFADNLFSAAELIVKSLLIGGSSKTFRSHNSIQITFNFMAHHGLYSQEHKAVFNQLSELRRTARYSVDTAAFCGDEARKLLQKVKDMWLYARKDSESLLNAS